MHRCELLYELQCIKESMLEAFDDIDQHYRNHSGKCTCPEIYAAANEIINLCYAWKNTKKAINENT